jgi:hypothetical protein
MQIYQFHQAWSRRSFWIVSIPLGNGSVVRFGEQLSQKVNKHGNSAGLTAGRGSHGADRLSKRGVDFFKAEAGRSRTSYQRMIRRLLDTYAER